MTLNDLIPGRRAPKPRKANRTEVKLARTKEQLTAVQRDIAKLLNWQAGADDFFAILMQDRDEVYAAWRFAEQKRQEAETVAACALEKNEGLAAEVAELRRELAPFLAAEANANRVDVPPMFRDTSDPADQATGPINVTALWEARDAGLLGAVTDPGHVPVVRDEPAT